METNTNTNGTGPKELATPAVTSEATEHARSRARRYLGAGWRFTRHLVEMVIAMFAGMGLLGLALWVLDEPPGYSNLLVRYGLMGAFMAAPMVAWMRYRGHFWSDGVEMTAAMLVPMFTPVVLMESGVAVPGLSEASLPLFAHVGMIAGMVTLMVFRFDRYARGPHGHRA
jgi:hypothetical protein